MKKEFRQLHNQEAIALEATKPQRLVSMQDVARMAGLSKATVSLALRGDPRINEKTRERVTAIAERLNYKRNKLATGIFTQKSHLFAVVYPSLVSDFLTEIIDGIDKGAFEAGYMTAQHGTGGNEADEHAFLQHLMEMRIDGILMLPVEEAGQYQSYEELRRHNIPVVVIDKAFKELPVDYVVTDDFPSAYNATKHLIDLGHRRIAHIAGPDSSTTARARREGFFTAMVDAGMPIQRTFLMEASYQHGWQEGHDVMLKLMQQPIPPTAIFAVSDFAAMGAYRALHDLGLRVPDDVSIVGYADLGFSKHLAPPLTTVYQPTSKMGEVAVEALLRRIENPDIEQQRIVLPTSLVIRESTAPPRG